MARPSKEQKLSPLGSGFNSNLSDVIAKKSSSQTLRTLRKRQGYTLADLAQLTGLSPSYISRLEAGDRRYNSDLLAKFAKVLGCSEADLLKCSDESISAPKEVVYVPQKDLPVYSVTAGSAFVGSNYLYAIVDFSEPESRIFRLPQLLGISSAFAFRVVDNSCAPKYDVGDLVYVHTQRSVSRNSPVVLITQENYIVMGEIVDWNDETLKIRNYKSAEEITFAKKDLQASYSVLCSFSNYKA